MAKKSNYQFYLTEPLTSAGTEVDISTLIGTGEEVSLTTETSMTISYEDRTVVERVKGTAASGVLTLSERGLDDGETPAADATLKLDWRPGAIVTVTLHPDDIPEKDATENIPGSRSFTKGLQIPVFADSTSRDTAIPSPLNGQLSYLTDTGLAYCFLAGSWVSLGTSGTFSNASEAAAGKVEKGTDAQGIAGTQLGETGAYLFLSPDQISKIIQSGSRLYGADAGGDDTYVVALTPVLAAYTTGQILAFKTTTANTGACTVDFGPGAKSIKTKDGNDPQSGMIRASGFNIVIYDGTNMVLLQEDLASATNRGTSEQATQAEVLAEADTSRFIVPVDLGAWGEIYGVEMIAGTTYTAQSANTERSTGGSTYVKVKEFEVVKGGTFRISFELKGSVNGAEFYYGRIYKNGVAFGAEKSTTSATYAAQTDDLTFADGDSCELRIKGQTGTRTTLVQNFNMKYDFQPRFKANVNVTVTTD